MLALVLHRLLKLLELYRCGSEVLLLLLVLRLLLGTGEVEKSSGLTTVDETDDEIEYKDADLLSSSSLCLCGPSSSLSCAVTAWHWRNRHGLLCSSL